MEEFVKFIHTLKPDKVLDVATGRGEFVHFLQENLKGYNTIIGIDTDKKMLEKAKDSFAASKLKFKIMDATNIDFPDDYFDIVSISNSLHHMENLNSALAEIFRILKLNGYLIINEMVSDGKQTDAQKNHIAIHHWAAAIDRERGRYHAETFSRSKVNKLISETNIKSYEVYEYSHKSENPLDEKIVGNLTDKIDQYIKILSKKENTENLIEQGKKIKKNIVKVGFASATSLFIIARK